MKSTDNNINKPLKVDTLHLAREVESWQFVNVIYESQNEYHARNFYDPHTAYVITDINPPRVYYGSIRVDQDLYNAPKYVMGITPKGEYAIYMNTQLNLIQISKYEDPQKAFEALKIINNTGSHLKWNWCVYNYITNYIDKNITCNQMIISIITQLFKIKELPAFQSFIQILRLDGADDKYEDISRLLREDLDRWTSAEFQRIDDYSQQVYNMMSIYSDVYNIIVKYNFFKADKYHDPSGDIDLSAVIDDIAYKVGYKYLNEIQRWF